MKKILLTLAALLAALSSPAFAQYTSVYGNTVGGLGHLAANATIYWQPVEAARIGTGGGQILGVPVTATVTAGAFVVPTDSIADTSLSDPENVCYAVTVVDKLTGNVLLGAGLASDGVHVNTGGAYGCVQPSGSSWDFDSYVPAAPATALVVAGPAGPAGTSNWRGAWAASTAYAKNDGFVEGGNGYVVFNAYTSGSSFGSTDTANAVELASSTLSSLGFGIVTVDQVSGDAGAAINTLFATYNVVEITAANATATTVFTVPNSATGPNGIAGKLIIRGAGTLTIPQGLLADSTTTEVQSGSIECPEGATIRLANGSNQDLISDTNFATLTGTTNAYGLNGAKILGCILDGNRANNTSGWALRLYGRGLEIKGAVQNGKSGGAWLENHDASSFTNPPDDDAEFANDLRAIDNGGDGVYVPAGQGWVFKNLISWGNSSWGFETAGPASAVTMNTFLNGSGGCHVATGGVLYATNATCSSAAGYGLLIDSGTGESIITGSFGCNGCVGIEVKASGQQITGFLGNSSQALVIDGGSLTGNFIVGANTGTLVTLTSEATSSWLNIAGNTTGGTGCFSTTPLSTDVIFATTVGGSAPCLVTQLPPLNTLIANGSAGELALIPNSGFNFLQSGTMNGAANQNLALSGPSGAQLSEIEVNALLTAFTGNVSIPTGYSYEINGVPILSGIANVQLTMPTSAIGAGTCTSPATVTMTGLVAPSGGTPGSALTAIYEGNPTGVTGWGASGGLSLKAWVSATNTLSWSVCNTTGSSITPGAMKVDLGAK